MQHMPLDSHLWPTDVSTSDLLCTGSRIFDNYLLENHSLASKILWYFLMLYQGLSVEKISFDSMTWPQPLSFTSAWTAPSGKNAVDAQLQTSLPREREINRVIWTGRNTKMVKILLISAIRRETLCQSGFLHLTIFIRRSIFSPVVRLLLGSAEHVS
jgi:hypothetical protein